MRLLFSFILTTFFFIAPHGAEAKTVFGKDGRAATFAKHFTPTEATCFSEIDHQTTITFQRNNVRSFSGQQRLVPGIHPGYLGQLITLNEVLLHPGRDLEPYSHFTPIAHKLIFPEHFFW